ncbi:MAG: hypothetical protein PHS30_06930 [Bacteroidales bacterium]|nr:hypothetical protein [Bacteroidales bacterium]
MKEFQKQISDLQQIIRDMKHKGELSAYNEACRQNAIDKVEEAVRYLLSMSV